jgi:crotonobetainyl-CoA:carnitine CoA-transferase CaiB-like acyl-CoA transferase
VIWAQTLSRWNPRGANERAGFRIRRRVFRLLQQKQDLCRTRLSTPSGAQSLRDLLATADVMIENMGPGAMERAGLSPDEVRTLNPALVYCRLKGFLPGLYDSRVALDEVVQMMSGLAYMTGPPGMPLRCGTSITDISAAIFGAVGILSALRERDTTGIGSVVEAALFETAAFLVGQHMAYAAVVQHPVPPMPARVSAWAIYDLFTLRDGQVFVGITSDKQWRAFCRHTGRDDLGRDARLTTNEDRILAREWLMPELQRMFSRLSSSELAALCDACGLPFGHLATPEALFTDPHLIESGALADTTLPSGEQTRLPKLPIRIAGHSFELRKQPSSSL